MARGGSGGMRMLHWLAIALIIILADQFSKLLIIGAAFSFLADASGWQRWFFTALGLGAAGFIVWLLRQHAGQTLFCFAISCVLGGALGNVIDRMAYGYVVDFLDFHAAGLHFPAFNLADSAITLGAICMILDELLRVRRAR